MDTFKSLKLAGVAAVASAADPAFAASTPKVCVVMEESDPERIRVLLDGFGRGDG